jgi:RNA polymerase sigma-70 factor (ECF subfamily)
MPLAGSDTTAARPGRAAPRTPPDLASLYREHAGTVARWAAHLGGPGADVEDLVHEVFLVAGRRLGDFRGDAKVTTWLYRITERVTRSRRRKDRMRRFFWRSRGDDVGAALAASHLSPVEELERRQATETVYRILDRLDEKYRTVLVLFELEGMSDEQIAALTGKKLATVWVHLHRARAQFLREMNRDDGRSP